MFLFLYPYFVLFTAFNFVNRSTDVAINLVAGTRGGKNSRRDSSLA